MGDYWQITRVYLNGKTASLWCFLLLCLLAVSGFGEELERNVGTAMGGVLSKKSYLAMFAYFNACLLGALLRDNLARPWALVMPHYRKKHLLVTAFLAVSLLAIPMLLIAPVGTTDIAWLSVVVIFLTCVAAGLWTLHQPTLGVLALPFLAFVFTPASSSPLLAAFLAGTSLLTSAMLIFVSLSSLAALAWRLLSFNAESPEYATARVWGDFLRGQFPLGLIGPSFQGSFFQGSLTTEKQANGHPWGSPISSMSNLQQVDKLSSSSERILWERLKLWRLGTSQTPTFVSVGYLMGLALLMMPPMVVLQRWAGVENPAKSVVVIMSVMVMTNPITIWIPWIKRLPRLGYESLRPRTRHEFIRELGLSLLSDIAQFWLGGVLTAGIAAAIWARELLQFNHAVLFILGTGAGQLCVFGAMGIWLLKRRGMAASLTRQFHPLLAMACWTLFVVMNERVGFEVNLALTFILASLSVATIWLAYRRWCRTDLNWL